MTQVLQVPNLRTVKLVAEQSNGTERALLTDSDGHLQMDVISGTVTPAGATDDSAAGTTISLAGGRYDAAPDDVDDGDAVTVQCDIKGRLITVDKNEATDDAAAPAAGVMVCGKFASMSPDANDAAFLRVGSTGEVVTADLNTATDNAAAKTVGPQVMAIYSAAPAARDDGDAVPLLSDSSGKLQVTETSAAAIKTAAELLSAEVVVGDGIMVRSDTAANFLNTEANSGAIKTAVEIIDDWDAVSGAACGTDGAVVMGLASAAAPAAVDAADAVRVLCDRQGRVAVTGNHAFAQGSGDYQVAAAACVVHLITVSCTVAGVLTVYNNIAEAAPAGFVFAVPAAGVYSFPLGGAYFGTGCYVGKDGAFTGECTVVYDLA